LKEGKIDETRGGEGGPVYKPERGGQNKNKILEFPSRTPNPHEKRGAGAHKGEQKIGSPLVDMKGGL